MNKSKEKLNLFTNKTKDNSRQNNKLSSDTNSTAKFMSNNFNEPTKYKDIKTLYKKIKSIKELNSKSVQIFQSK